MDGKNNRSSVIIGTLLLATGILALLGQIFGQGNSGLLWPIIIIGFGLAFLVGMLLGGRSFGALAVPGSIITGIGLILFIQNFFSIWETWSYTWTLILCFVGIGLYIYGLWSNLPDLRSSGLKIAQVGLILFLIFGILFEGVFAISGITQPVSGLLWPIVLIVLGLGMLVIRSYRLLRKREQEIHSDVNLFWPVIFIGAGLLWISVKLNYVTSDQVNSLISLWPVLIVAAGVNLLLGRRMQWINLLFGAAVVVGMFYMVFNSERLGISSRSPWGMLGFQINSEAPVTEWISGSGNIVEVTRQVKNVNEVRLYGSGELEIIQGSTPSLIIKAEDNLIPYILTEENNGRLTIKIKEGVGFSSTQPIHYQLTVKDIREIDASGSAEINSNNLETDTLEINLSGYGNVTLNNLKVEKLNLSISGSGNMEASGFVNEMDISISGAGGFTGPELRADEVKVNISGIGRAVVWAVNRLKPEISGVGSVSYYGDPVVVENTSGLANVNRIGSK